MGGPDEPGLGPTEYIIIPKEFVIQRTGKMTVQFLLERGILVKRSAGNALERKMIFSDPRSLKAWKTSFHQYTAVCDFFSLPRKLGARG